MNYPLVTVICLCYNHERFLAEALDSVLAQTYPNLEIIVADDASTDQSVSIILKYCQLHPHIHFIQNLENLGSCTAFNRAFQQSNGEYILDFATDDVLLPNRIAEQVACFATLAADYGVVYTDALLINELSQPIRTFYQKTPTGKLKPNPLSGWVYADLVKQFFISAPTMLIKRIVLEQIGGYNEKLAYEDFDFWVRSSRYFRYHYLPKVLTKRRLHPQQQSRQIYKKNDKQLASTVLVCQTALQLNRTEIEHAALIFRIKYEFKKAVSTANFEEARQLANILRKLNALNGLTKLAAELITCIIRLRKWVGNFKLRSLHDSD